MVMHRGKGSHFGISKDRKRRHAKKEEGDNKGRNWLPLLLRAEAFTCKILTQIHNSYKRKHQQHYHLFQ